MLCFNLNINYFYFSSDDDETVEIPPKKIVMEEQIEFKQPVIEKFVNQMDQPEYEVDQILEKREKLSGIEYLVHWKGYSCDHDSWEPLQYLHCDDILKEFEECWEHDLEKYKALKSKTEERKITNMKKKKMKRFYNSSNIQNNLPSTSYAQHDLPTTSCSKSDPCYCEKHSFSTENYSDSD